MVVEGEVCILQAEDGRREAQEYHRLGNEEEEEEGEPARLKDE